MQLPEAVAEKSGRQHHERDRGDQEELAQRYARGAVIQDDACRRSDREPQHPAEYEGHVRTLAGRAREEKERRLEPLAANRRERQQGERGNRAAGESAVDLVPQRAGNARRLPLHPEQHPREHRHGEEHRESFERRKHPAVELPRCDLETGTHGEGECRSGRYPVPDLAKVPLLVDPPQVTEKDRDDQGYLDPFTGGDQQRKEHQGRGSKLRGGMISTYLL